MNAPAWPVSGRSVPRWRGAPVTHDVRFAGLDDGRTRASCEPCDWHVTLDPGHTDGEKARLARMHEGTEDAE